LPSLSSSSGTTPASQSRRRHVSADRSSPSAVVPPTSPARLPASTWTITAVGTISAEILVGHRHQGDPRSHLPARSRIAASEDGDRSGGRREALRRSSHDRRGAATRKRRRATPVAHSGFAPRAPRPPRGRRSRGDPPAVVPRDGVCLFPGCASVRVVDGELALCDLRGDPIEAAPPRSAGLALHLRCRVLEPGLGGSVEAEPGDGGRRVKVGPCTSLGHSRKEFDEI
jgi:hypothetical protein